ncbi:MAG: tRNA (adenosine(37)-N6)-threonylcarbamoyltransferase complex dimerization subunit type 1 TsaB [Chloroflexi bacterium]|nr:tRNA (adenosine(37)-N6)-threonylcarbamoyltransferase complex dimerization subunit type 1 TsaB [Chloroflexota bacterium]
MMMLLALDTATQMVSIALHNGDQIVAEHTWHSPNQHTRQIPPAVRAILKDSRTPLDALTAVVVAAGPGSYTGLRVGMGFAKGVAGAAGLPLIGVSTLDIVATATPQCSGALIVTLQAGRSRISVARYQWRKGEWKARGDAENMTWDELIASIDGVATITGEVDAAGRERLDAAIAEGATLQVLPATVRLRRAGALAEIGWRRLREEGAEAFPPESVAPVYIQTKDSPA